MKTNGHTIAGDDPEEDDIEAGPQLPLADEEPLNDEDGRFFGGGVAKDTAEVLNFIDERDKGNEVSQ